jgi:positive regulator of sigma E activity
MRTLARVHDVREGRAWLACEAASAGCAACGGRRGCTLRWLDRSGGGLLVVPAQGAGGPPLAPGDAVTVEVSEGELLRAAFAAYLPPLAGVLAGPLLAIHLAATDEPAAVAAAGIGLLLGWAVSRAWLRRVPPRFELSAPERS